MQPNLINTVNKYDQLEHCPWLLFQTIVPAKTIAQVVNTSHIGNFAVQGFFGKN